MGGSKTVVNQPAAPAPVDPGESMGDYLFGKGFDKFKGVTDPRLQELLIGAEETFRPRYAALELADINTFAFGTEAGMGSDQYKAKEAEIKALKQAKAKGTGNIDPAAMAKNALGPRPPKQIGSGRSRRHNPAWDDWGKRYNSLKKQFGTLNSSADIDSKIAIAESQLKSIGQRKAQGGLFDLLEEAGTRSAEMQRESLAAQRADDVSALQEFAPQVVEAYRAADPYSTELAEQTSRRAMGRLTADEERDIQQQARQAAMARGRTGASAEFGEVLARRQFTDQYTQPAFQMNRALAGDVGMTILGRPSSGLALGGAMLGQAQNQAAGPMGPQLFDPNMGINMAMQQRSQDMNLMGAQMQANATAQAGRTSAMGNIAGALIGLCWVAREVYGVDNPRWIEFRHWVIHKSPNWLFKLYLNYGEKFAHFISNKPFIKKLIRKWMDTKIS